MSLKMKRMQIYLEHDLDRELDNLASSRGVSKAQLIREGARKIILEKTTLKKDPILAIVGLGRSAPNRISEEHDQYLIKSKHGKK